VPFGQMTSRLKLCKPCPSHPIAARTGRWPAVHLPPYHPLPAVVSLMTLRRRLGPPAPPQQRSRASTAGPPRARILTRSRAGRPSYCPETAYIPSAAPVGRERSVTAVETKIARVEVGRGGRCPRRQPASQTTKPRPQRGGTNRPSMRPK